MNSWLLFSISFLRLIYAEADRTCEVKESNIFYPCTLPTDVLQVTKATFEPEIIKAGEDLWFTIWGNVTEQVDDGHLKVTTSLGPIGYNLVDQTLTKERFDTPISFPIKPGPFMVKRRFLVPSIAPPITYKIVVNSETDTGKKLFYLVSNLKVSF
jgi:hypothetical protein